MRFLWGYWVCPSCGASRYGIINMMPPARCHECQAGMVASRTPTLPRPQQEAGQG